MFLLWELRNQDLLHIQAVTLFKSKVAQLLLLCKCSTDKHALSKGVAILLACQCIQ